MSKYTQKLANKHLWYSLEYQDGIKPDSLEAYGNDYKDTVYLQHMLGQKQFELTDHLGNVLAVVGETRHVRTYDTITGYPPLARCSGSSRRGEPELLIVPVLRTASRCCSPMPITSWP